MKFLPVSLNITGKKILVVGGGKTAFQKIKTLRQFTKAITVIALKVSSEIKNSGLAYRQKTYASDDLSGYSLVFACTNDKKVNARIKRDANRTGILVNVVDSPKSCDFISPAIYKKGNLSCAVSSQGRNVKKSIAMRNKIKSVFEK